MKARVHTPTNPHQPTPTTIGWFRFQRTKHGSATAAILNVLKRRCTPAHYHCTQCVSYLVPCVCVCVCDGADWVAFWAAGRSSSHNTWFTGCGLGERQIIYVRNIHNSGAHICARDNARNAHANRINAKYARIRRTAKLVVQNETSVTSVTSDYLVTVYTSGFKMQTSV